MDDIKIRRLRWVGHIIRMEDERIPKKVLDGKLNNTRPVGKPRTRWDDDDDDDHHHHHHHHHVFCSDQDSGTLVPSPSIHGRVGFVVEELKLTTISYIALMMNFNILVVVVEYYSNINSKVSAGENRCFSK